ncbi:MAG: amidohydrolase family protein [Acidimicrobiales bacterium]
MIIDMHNSVVPSAADAAVDALARSPHVQFDPATCTVDATLARMDRAEVDRSVVWCLGGSLDACRRYNDFIAETARRHPDRFVPFATAHPEGGDDSIEEVRRAAEDLGMRGLKLHPDVFTTAIDDPRFLALVAAARDHRLPFVTHVHPTLVSELPEPDDEETDDPITTTPRPTFSAAALVPELVRIWDSPRVQLAHMGAVTRTDVRASNVTFQTAGASVPVIRWAIGAVGVERIVFGSDYPFFSVEGEIAKIRQLALTAADAALVLGGNAADRVLAPSPA